MKTVLGFTSAAAAALVLASVAGTAQADDIAVTYNAAIASDYVFRGVSQTDEGPAVQAGVDLSSGIFYAGAWASNVDFGDSTDAEVDLYAGVKPQVGGFTFDFGVVAYLYPGEPSSADWTYVEGKIGVSHPITETSSFGIVAYYSDDFTGGSGPAWYYEANASAKLAEKWSISGAVGHQDVDYAGDFTGWNVGIAYSLTDNIALDVRYYDTDEHSFGDIYDARGVVALKAAW